MAKIYILGSCSVDLSTISNRQPKIGETLIGKSFFANIGGKGANQANAISKLFDGESFFIGCLGGDDFGTKIYSALKSTKLNIDNLKIIDNETSGIASINIVDGNNAIIVVQGTNAMISKEQIDISLKQAQKYDYILFQAENNINVIDYAIKKSKSLGMVVILNNAPGIKISEDYLKYVDYLLINEVECNDLCNIVPNNNDDCLSAYEFFSQRGCNKVIITLGSKGSVYLFNKEITKIEPFKIDSIDSTGAGDAYVGAFVAFLASGKQVKEALTLSSAVGSLACTKFGAFDSAPNKKELKIFMERYNYGKN